MQVPETEVIVTDADGAELLRTVLVPGEYVIGRNTDCELPVISDQVSRKHALLTINFDHALIEDLGSSNGTFINGQPVKESARLWPNQKIQLGATTLELRPTKSPAHKYSLPPGLRLRHYVIVRLLGHGGFGLTYLADDTNLHRKVAIKEMLPFDFAIRESDGTTVVARSQEDKSNLEWARQRFVEEGRTLAALQHPSILSVHDIFEEHGTAYLVTAFIEGFNFEDFLRQGRALPQQELLSITNSLLDALHLVHEGGFLHRDIKPQNILIDRKTSRPVLIDFGNARMASGQKTASITAVLTRGYAPMEQYQTRARQGPSTDVYALGAVLYRAIKGAPPDDAIDRLDEDKIQVLSRQGVPGYTREFLATIDKALQMKRENRWQTCEEWKVALRGGQTSVPLQPASPRPAPAPSDPPRSVAPQSAPQKSATQRQDPPPLPPPQARSKSGLAPFKGESIPDLLRRNKGPLWGTAALLALAVILCLAIWHSSPVPTLPTPVQTPGPTPTPDPAPASITPATATKDAPFVNTLGMDFVPVPGTSVLFCETDTRVSDWQAFIQEEGDSGQWGIYALDEKEVKWVVKKDLSWKNPGFTQIGEDPVVGVSWEDARRFCAWLGKKEGRTYRLPTDAEWSAAVGSRKYPWGSVWPPPEGAGNYCGSESRLKSDASGMSAWTTIEGYNDGYPRTSPVGKFNANALGLYDIGGNVWQWCEDEYRASMNDAEALEKAPGLKNEKASDGIPYRVLRGGSWGNDDPFILRSTCRVNVSPTYRSVRTGFRCVLVSSQTSAPTPVQTPPPKPAPSSITPTTATKDAPFVNTLGMEFVPVPETSVLFCRTDTRVKDFRQYAVETNYQQTGGIFVMKVKAAADGSLSLAWEEDSTASWNEPGFAQTGDHPVVGVNWNEARAFCEWLSKKEGWTYRLPTDEEWSAAVGLGTYPWGSAWPPPKGAGNFADQSFLNSLPGKDRTNELKDYDDLYPRTSPVGEFKANALGLFDMGGDVWQWCETEYKVSMNSAEALEKYPFLKNEKARDGMAYRVLRGGSWYDSNPIPLQSTFRNRDHPVMPKDNHGFRCILTLQSRATPAPVDVAKLEPPKPVLPSIPITPPPRQRDATVTATKDAPLVNTLGMEFVPVPGTSVLFCRTDTRVKDFRQYMSETNNRQTGGIYVMKAQTAADDRSSLEWDLDSTASWNKPGFEQTGDHPVVGVSWNEARDFCEWLSKKEGRTYRLPTDEEWSAAVGSGRYPWGNTGPPPNGAGNYADQSYLNSLPGKGWTDELKDYDDFYPRTSPVGKFKANALGLFDMGGNVWQWCETEYKASMNSAEALEKYPGIKNEKASDGTPYRVLRGGSWANADPVILRSMYRNPYHPAIRFDNYGFRCVLVVSGG